MIEIPKGAYSGETITIKAQVKSDKAVDTNIKLLYYDLVAQEQAVSVSGEQTVTFSFTVPQVPYKTELCFAVIVNYGDNYIPDRDLNNNYDTCRIITEPSPKEKALSDVSVEIVNPPAKAKAGDTVALSAMLKSSIPVSVNFKWMYFGQTIKEYNDLEVYGEKIITLNYVIPNVVSKTMLSFSVMTNYGDKLIYDADWTNNYQGFVLETFSEFDRVSALFGFMRMDARVLEDTYIYKDASYQSQLGMVKKNDVLGLFYEGWLGTWAKIYINNQIAYMPSDKLLLLGTQTILKDDPTNGEKELFVNSLGWNSKTNYLIWVNLERQRVNIFSGKQGEWKLFNSFLCATGTNYTPTIIGQFEYIELQQIWKFDDFYCAPIMRFYNGYAFHSYLLRYNGTVYDSTLGIPRSHGCIRVHPDNINWMAQNIKLGTKIVIR